MFETFTIDPVGGDHHLSATIGDLDNDGLNEIVVATYGTHTVYIFRVASAGAWSLERQIVLPAPQDFNEGYMSPHIVDMDGDGDRDLGLYLRGNNRQGRLLLLTYEAGDFIPSMFTLPETDPGYNMDVADVNADGFPDVLTADFGFSSGSPRLVVSYGGPVSARFNTFSAWPMPGTLVKVHAADADQDGDVDVLAGAHPFSSIGARLFLNDGSGGFAAFWDFVPADGSRAVDAAFGDVDGDGDRDLVTSASFPGGVHPYLKLYRRNGGVYVADETLSTGIDAKAPRLADFNGDGFLDLACDNARDRTLSFFFGDPQTGQLQLTHLVLSSADLLAGDHGTFGTPEPLLSVGDVDNDGDVDLVHAMQNLVVIRNRTIVDSDGDGVRDSLDRCPGHDDRVDPDGDGTPSGCDACPNDFYNDSDADGLCDSNDPCPLDAQNDADADGLCGNVDPCPADPDNDADNDGVCGNLDPCPLDASNDADGDGVCGNLEICAGGNDHVDTDGDGTPDFCDVCPVDFFNDSDGDGSCDSNDPCPLDVQNDADADGLCADVDDCPLDPENDLDGDGMCADADPCPDNVENDADGDGFCEEQDNCPTVPNVNQSDADGDGIGDACEPDNDGDGVVDDGDNCPLDPNPSQSDTDSDGVGDACDADDDNDGVPDGVDICLGTPPGSPVLGNGCSIEQQCPCNAPWKSHLAYVRCVTQAATALLTQCQITLAQWLDIVSAAACSSCGRRWGWH